MNLNLFKNDKVITGFSRRSNGSMRIADTRISANKNHASLKSIMADKLATKNREKYFEELGINKGAIVMAKLVHGARVETINAPLPAELRIPYPLTDALFTNQPGVFLTVTAADCPSIFFYDPKKGVVGLAHAGWKGILAGICENSVKKMREEYNCNPATIRAFIGPGVQLCHFEVGKEIAEKFDPFYFSKSVQVPKNPPAEDRGNNSTYDMMTKYYVNLYGAIAAELEYAGLNLDNIHHSTDCTFCHKGITKLETLPEKSKVEYQYFSYRREKSNPLETQMAVIGIKK